MATAVIPFQLGESASASKLMSNFSVLQNQGQVVIDQMTSYKTASLVEFQQQVDVLTARRQRANRVPAPFVAVAFVTTDLLDVDQTLTSATLRPDAQAASLKERPTLTGAVVMSQTFNTSSGTAEALSQNNTLYRVGVSDGSTPVGTFTLQLAATLSLSVVSFNLAALPSGPAISVTASSDGVNYVSALATSANGENLTAWFTPMDVRYIQVAVTPAAPDTLGGSSYTFGLSGLAGAQTGFELQSDFYTLPISFAPTSPSLHFTTTAAAGLNFYLDFNETGWADVVANTVVLVPGVTSGVITGAGLVAGVLSAVIPSNIYPSTLKAIDDTTGSAVSVIPGLSPADPKISQMVGNYLVLNGTTVTYVGPGASASTKTFSLSFVSGPASVTVRLKVQMSTSDNTVTPTFTGASLQEI